MAISHFGRYRPWPLSTQHSRKKDIPLILLVAIVVAVVVVVVVVVVVFN